MSEKLLENLYWISQILLALIATGAAYAALRQLSAYKLFELTKILDDPEFRNARATVFREIAPIQSETWWGKGKDSERMELAAYLVFAKYDSLAIMLEFSNVSQRLPKRGYGGLFIRNWAAGITRTHGILEPFLMHVRETNPSAYAAYSRLRDAAERIQDKSRKLPALEKPEPNSGEP